MIRIDSRSFTDTAVRLAETRARTAAASALAIKTAGPIVLNKVRDRISLRDHPQSVLTALDHPYARRRGSIAIHRGGSGRRSGNKKDGATTNVVHSQSGSMLNSLRGKMVGNKYQISFDTGIAPHAVFIIRGTRVMLRRDVLWDTANAPRTRTQVRLAIIKVITAQLGIRTQVKVR